MDVYDIAPGRSCALAKRPPGLVATEPRRPSSAPAAHSSPAAAARAPRRTRARYAARTARRGSARLPRASPEPYVTAVPAAPPTGQAVRRRSARFATPAPSDPLYRVGLASPELFAPCAAVALASPRQSRSCRAPRWRSSLRRTGAVRAVRRGGARLFGASARAVFARRYPLRGEKRRALTPDADWPTCHERVRRERDGRSAVAFDALSPLLRRRLRRRVPWRVGQWRTARTGGRARR
jgi:hypothetical protein